MIWINCNLQVGREIKDIHPLLVLSPNAFNERTGIVIGLPMTTAAFNETNPFAVKFMGPRRQASYILEHQPKSSTGGCAKPSRTRGSKSRKMRFCSRVRR
jgi:mRNA interferase MazF